MGNWLREGHISQVPQNNNLVYLDVTSRYNCAMICKRNLNEIMFFLNRLYNQLDRLNIFILHDLNENVSWPK